MPYRVTLIPGDGIGPELAEATRRVLDASGVAFDWEVQDAGEGVMAQYGTPLPEHVLESIRRNKVALKGPITTPVGAGFRSVNVALRQTLGLYANLRPARSMKGLDTRYQDVDLVIVRENTEDLYAGIEHMVGPDAAESIKIITRAASERIARFAFEYAVANGRHKVTAVHKANPTALLLSGVLMLRHLGEQAAAVRVETALREVIAEGKATTYDLGGPAGTREFADAIISRLGSSAAAS
jgi:isocitrate dehydrogenase (NAD+)